ARRCVVHPRRAVRAWARLLVLRRGLGLASARDAPGRVGTRDLDLPQPGGRPGYRGRLGDHAAVARQGTKVGDYAIPRDRGRRRCGLDAGGSLSRSRDRVTANAAPVEARETSTQESPLPTQMGDLPDPAPRRTSGSSTAGLAAVRTSPFP